MRPRNRSEEAGSQGDWTRREFLGTVGAMSVAAPSLSALPAVAGDRAVIQLLLVGGPSQLDTWDPKPDAPTNVRGPFAAIPTSAPGVAISELFPRMAQRADRFALLRTVCHRDAPIHETGLQRVQTGGLCADESPPPAMGAVVARTLGRRRGAPAWVVTPGPIGDTGVDLPRGQSAGGLGADFEPVIMEADASDWRWTLGGDRESASVRDRYGATTFGQACRQARRLVEAGVRVVTVNMFDTVFHKLSWDMHAAGGRLPVTMEDYRRSVCPMFDQAYAALLDDLDERGLLSDVLVVATGEFGRTPRLNARGGRDHWTGAWTAVVAGGGIQGGQAIGRTDAIAGEPIDRPIAPAEIVATMRHHLGIDPREWTRGNGSAPARIEELF